MNYHDCLTRKYLFIFRQISPETPWCKKWLIEHYTEIPLDDVIQPDQRYVLRYARRCKQKVVKWYQDQKVAKWYQDGNASANRCTLECQTLYGFGILKRTFMHWLKTFIHIRTWNHMKDTFCEQMKGDTCDRRNRQKVLRRPTSRSRSSQPSVAHTAIPT